MKARMAELDALEDSARVTLVLPRRGPEASRRRVALELLVQRTLAEVRAAWDGLDRGDRDAVTRRLERRAGCAGCSPSGASCGTTSCATCPTSTRSSGRCSAPATSRRRRGGASARGRTTPS
ncbi:MAG: hypothetical protein IPF99_31630 [Deltaproteobacteria bacterium]|nr:hypothetical protein [Deltaproteobacteria bacterium]